MEQLLKDIQNLFIEFQFLELHIQFELEYPKFVEPNWNEIDDKYDFETTNVERKLQLVYLQGNDIALQRIKWELDNLKQLINRSNFGFDISFENKTKGNFQKRIENLIIEPEIIDKINSIKLHYINKLVKYIDSLRFSTNSQTVTKTEQETENNFTHSTIEDWLFEFKEKMSETDYLNLVSALMKYFETGTFPILSKPIQINGRLNKKLFGWALNRIFETKGKGVEKELLQFAKQNISLFTDVKFDEKNFMKSNLYKYFTTQTK